MLKETLHSEQDSGYNKKSAKILKKEVVNRQTNSHRALMLVAGLAAGAGCAAVSGDSEHIGSNSEKLVWSQGTAGDNFAAKTYKTSVTAKFRLFTSDRPGGAGGYDFYGSKWNGTVWSAAVPIGGGINNSSNQDGITYGVGGWCGAGKIIYSSDEGTTSEDLYAADFDPVNMVASNKIKLPASINIAFQARGGVELNSNCTNLIYDDIISGSNSDLKQAVPGVWTPQLLTGVNTANAEGYPFHCGPLAAPESKLCFSRSPGITGKGDILQGDYNAATATVINIKNMNLVFPGINEANKYSSGGNVDPDGVLVYSKGDVGIIPTSIIEEQLYPAPVLEAGTPETGTQTDSGIPLASCKIINVTQNPENFKLYTCDEKGFKFTGKILGPTTYSIGTATDVVKRVQPKQASEISMTDERTLHYGDGVLHRMKENEPDPAKKKIVYQWGDPTGMEGTDHEWDQPDEPALNPPEDIAQGKTRIISQETREGLTINHRGETCPPGSDIKKCPTDNNFAPEGALKDGIVYQEYINGKRGKSSVNKADLEIKPPIVIPPVVETPPEKPKGCLCTTTHQGISETRLGLGDLGVIGVGGFLTVGLLRKKEEPQVKPKKDKDKETKMAA